MKTGVIGLGKLGIPMLAAHVVNQLDVKGFDVNPNTISSLRARQIPIVEQGIKEIMEIDALWPERFCSNLESLYLHADILFVVVPTPSVSDSFFEIKYVREVVEQIALLDKQHGKNLDLVITSTINPGDSEQLLELLVDSKVNLLYSPEFIVLGNVLENMLKPDIRIIGSDNPYATDRLVWVFNKLNGNGPQYHYLSHLEAEITKISINSFLTIKISFANTIGAMVHTYTHGDMQSVRRTLEAIGADPRIGNRYLKFGTGFSGPCFPRDNKCLSHHLRRKGLSSHLPSASDNVNQFMLEYWTRVLSQNIGQIKNVVIVGLSYKEHSDFTDESFVIQLYHKIKTLDKQFYFIDNLVQSFPNMTKLDSIDLDPQTTLVLINHGSEELKHFARKNYKCIDLW